MISNEPQFKKDNFLSSNSSSNNNKSSDHNDKLDELKKKNITHISSETLFKNDKAF